MPAAERYEAAYFVEAGEAVDPRRPALRGDRRGAARPALRRRPQIQTTVDLATQARGGGGGRRVLPDAEHDPDVALVSIEPRTGYVRAMVGGRDFFGAGRSGEVQPRDAGPRQAGSAFKPFVLAAALAEGIPATTTYSAPGVHHDPMHAPAVATRATTPTAGRRASVDLVEGTVHSYNTLYAQLILRRRARGRDGAGRRRCGIRSPLDAAPSAVLGTNDVTALDMACGVATFANRGVQVAPVLVTRITRADGTVLYRHEHRQERVLDADVADTVTAILAQVVERGTGTGAHASTAPRPARPAPTTTSTTPGSSATRRTSRRRCGSASTRREISMEPPHDADPGHRRQLPGPDLAALHERGRGRARPSTSSTPAPADAFVPTAAPIRGHPLAASCPASSGDSDDAVHACPAPEPPTTAPGRQRPDRGASPT